MEIKEVMQKSEGMGMRTFDSALFYLYKEGKISLEEALKNADAENNLRLRIELEDKGDSAAKSSEDTFNGLSLIEEPEEEDDDEENDENFLQGVSVFATPDVSQKPKQN
jgi:twitching motility protein PilU